MEKVGQQTWLDIAIVPLFVPLHCTFLSVSLSSVHIHVSVMFILHATQQLIDLIASRVTVVQQLFFNFKTEIEHRYLTMKQQSKQKN